MPKQNHAQPEQTSQDQNDATQPQAPAAKTEPLVGSLCPWTKYENSVIDHARVTQLDLQIARRSASGLHGVLRVLDAHREAVSWGDRPLLNENIEGALFDAATQLLNDLSGQIEGWAEKVGKA